ncbi:MAG: ABC transporter permease [Anaerocolumna sp.]
MKYYFYKLIMLFLVLFVISILVFLAFQVLPGDPVNVILGTDATQERVGQLTKQLSLDKSLGERYFIWLSGVMHGDFGTSIKYQIPVSDILSSRMPVTICLALLAFVYIIILAFPLGLLAGRYYDSFAGRIIHTISNIGTAVPSYFLCILIILVFSISLKWFNIGSFVPMEEGVIHFIMNLIPPAFAIAIPSSAMIIKFLRGSIKEQLHLDYVRTAKSKGCSENRIMIFHVFRNAMITTIAILGMVIADILSGSIVVEQVFNIPGIGRLLITSIGARDFPMLETLVLFIAAIVVVVNFLVDITFKIIDPRIRIN